MKTFYIFVLVLIVGLFDCSANDTNAQLVNFINPGEDCELPCFGSLNVSESSLEQVVGVIDELTKISEDGTAQQIGSTYNFWTTIEPQGLFTLVLQVDKETLTSVTARISNPELWSVTPSVELDSISVQMGNPDAIYIIFRGPPAGYSILFIFEEHNTVLQYSFVVNTPQFFQDNDPIPYCPISSEITTLVQLNIWVVSDAHDDWILDVIPDLYDDRETRPWVPLESVTGISVQQFISNPGNECFSLTSFGDLREQGYQF